MKLSLLSLATLVTAAVADLDPIVIKVRHCWTFK
jgi:hypothetical protein